MTDDAKKSVQDESNNIYTELKKYKVIEIPSELELIINEKIFWPKNKKFHGILEPHLEVVR